MREPPDKIEGGYVYRGMIDRGAKYKDTVSGEVKDFIGEDGRKYIGLLDGNGEPLKIGEPLHILWFKVEKEPPLANRLVTGSVALGCYARKHRR